MARHHFNQKTYNRRYCRTCGQEQRLDRGDWYDYGPIDVSPDLCVTEKKLLLKIIYGTVG